MTQKYRLTNENTLFDELTYEHRCNQISNLRQVAEKAHALLKDYGYPVERGWLLAVLRDGAAGLEAQVRQAAADAAESAKMPKFLIEEWKKAATDRIPDVAAEQAADIHLDAVRCSDGLPIRLNEDFSTDSDGVHINEEEICDRIRQGCTIPITPAHQKDAHDVKKFIKTFRELQERGLNVMDLLQSYGGNWLAPSKYPAIELENMIEDIVTHRHPSREQVKQNNRDWYYLHGGE